MEQLANIQIVEVTIAAAFLIGAILVAHTTIGEV